MPSADDALAFLQRCPPVWGCLSISFRAETAQDCRFHSEEGSAPNPKPCFSVCVGHDRLQSFRVVQIGPKGCSGRGMNCLLHC